MAKLEERLRRELDRIATPGDPAGVAERVSRRAIHRSIVRRIETVALAIVVIAGTISGVVVLNRTFRAGGPIHPAGDISLTPTPTESPSGAAAGVTLLPGVGPVCGLTSVEGDFLGKGAKGRAFVYSLPAQGGDCLPPGRAEHYLGVDLGSGTVAVTTGPFECPAFLDCWAFAAPDLDDDGVSEIAVVQDAGASTEFLGLYRVISGGSQPGADGAPTIERFEIAPPGDPEGGYDPGPGLFGWGGSAMHLAGVYCNQPALIAWTADANADGTEYTVRESPFVIDDSRLRFTAPTIRMVPTDSTLVLNGLPPGGGPELCGAPVQGTAETPGPGPTDNPVASTTSNGSTTVPGVGLACNVESMQGDFAGDGTTGTAYVFSKMPDVGGCRPPENGFQFLGVDPGTGSVEVTYGPLECDSPTGCHAFGAPDIDGDGRAEIAVLQLTGASAYAFGLYRVNSDDAGGWTIHRIEIAKPGDQALPPGPALVQWGGGLGAFGAAYCRVVAAGGTQFVVWSATVEGEANDTVSLHEVFLSTYDADGNLHVDHVDETSFPSDEQAAHLPPGGGSELCGATVS